MAIPVVTLSNHTETIKKEVKSPSFWRDVLGEFVACFFLMSVQCSVALSWGRQDVKGGPLLGNLSMGMLIMVLIETFGQFGGAHMNPAVSIAFVFAGRCTVWRAFIYTVTQLLGMSVGAAFTYFLTPAEFRENLAATQIRQGMTIWQGLQSEIWVTTLLLLVIYASTNEERRPVFMSSVIIGFYVFVAGCAGGEYSGASMNPARSFGPALVMNKWKDHWVYWVGPIMGGILGTFLFRCLFDNIGHPIVKLSDHVSSTEQGPNVKMESMSDIHSFRNSHTNDGFIKDSDDHIFNSHM